MRGSKIRAAKEGEPRNTQSGQKRLGKWGLGLVLLFLGLIETAVGEPAKAEAVPDAGWMRTFAAQQRQLKKKVDLCFVGDSLTAFWLHTGKAVWQLEFHAYKTANLGSSGDRTEHILYRVERSDFSKARPEVFVLLAGTNNLSRTPPDSEKATAGGVAKIVEAMRRKAPASKILLMSIPPNGYDPESALRKHVVAANKLLAKLGAGDSVEFLDVHDEFLDENGKWKRGLTVDRTHLSEAGYDVLARKIGPVVRKLLE
jgi:lysophospholipase L1-like esterase